jgi:hypothetical protein
MTRLAMATPGQSKSHPVLEAAARPVSRSNAVVVGLCVQARVVVICAAAEVACSPGVADVSDGRSGPLPAAAGVGRYLDLAPCTEVFCLVEEAVRAPWLANEQDPCWWLAVVSRLVIGGQLQAVGLPWSLMNQASGQYRSVAMASCSIAVAWSTSPTLSLPPQPSKVT